MLLVGLTGGIGSGKSTVVRAAAAEGRGRRRRRRGRAGSGRARRARARRAGGALRAGILDADGRLDRPALAAIAFADDDGRKALGDITWPAIGEEFERQHQGGPGRRGRRVRRAPPRGEQGRRAPGPTWRSSWWRRRSSLRLDRLEARGVARDDAERRMAAQATDDERREVATHVRRQRRRPRRRLARQVDDVWADLERLRARRSPTGITVVPRR